MKKRMGFVSNSSSSSFVILGKEISLTDIKAYKHVWFLGGSYGEGEDVFEIEEKDKDELIKAGLYKKISGQYVAALFADSGENDIKISPELAQKIIDAGGATVFAFEKSNYSSYDYGIDRVIERYYEYENF